MEVYAKPRQRGKTTDLIRLAAAEWLYIVSPDQNAARYTAEMARKMGLDIPLPITWGEFVSRRYHGRGVKGFVIDKLDMCVQQMTTVPIRAVSLNVPEPAEAGTTPGGSAAPG
jgi:hypothetical protein